MSPKAKHILVDGDPLQNSKVVMADIQQINGKLLWIPARSSDLNPIENLFYLARKDLNKDARNLHITTETMEKFAYEIQIIETMSKRIDLIIKNRGSRMYFSG